MLAVGRKKSRAPSSLSSSSSMLSNKNGCFDDLKIKGGRESHLSFYDVPPTSQVDLEAFETHGIARLQVLRRIDVLRARGMTGDKLAKEIIKADSQHFPLRPQNYEDKNKDYLSHYILRMAYCKTEELRRWFLLNECFLFKIRYNNAKPSDVDDFLKEQNVLMRCPPITDDEKMRLKPKLIGLFVASSSGSGSGGTATSSSGSSTMQQQNYYSMEFYKVPFTDVLPLVSKREVYMEAGFAYVSRTKILSIVEGMFRASLSKSLTQAYHMMYKWQIDTRIVSTINRLSKVAFRYGDSSNKSSNPNNVDTAAIIQIFTDYLTTVLGHSDPKTKPSFDKMYVSVGTRRPNAQDRMCPIANRAHKSNTQKYTIYFDTLVMEQGCWDGVCQATNRHVYYQIRDGRCVRVGWKPPIYSPPNTGSNSTTSGKSRNAAPPPQSSGGVPGVTKNKLN